MEASLEYLHERFEAGLRYVHLKNKETYRAMFNACLPYIATTEHPTRAELTNLTREAIKTVKFGPGWNSFWGWPAERVDKMMRWLGYDRILDEHRRVHYTQPEVA